MQQHWVCLPGKVAMLWSRSSSGSFLSFCQTLLAGFAGLWLGLVVFGNLVDYGSNWAFVRHVLAMDTIWSSDLRQSRAITSESVQRIAYAAIILTEGVAAILCSAGAAFMVVRIGKPSGLEFGRDVATAGLTLALLLYGGGFLAIGGEWFAMWQSEQWNGCDAAARFFEVLAAVLLILRIKPGPAQQGPDVRA